MPSKVFENLKASFWIPGLPYVVSSLLFILNLPSSQQPIESQLMSNVYLKAVKFKFIQNNYN